MNNPWFFNLFDKSLGIHRKLADGINAQIVFGEKVMLSVVRIEPHAKGVPHSHDEEQWGVLLKGSCIRIQGDTQREMIEGDFWYTPSNVVHTLQAGATGAVILDIFSPIRLDYTTEGKGFGN